MAQVLDYSAGFPGALAIVRAGYVGAVRYIGLPGRTKCTNRNEFEDFSRAGVGMALVFEEAAGNWRKGTAQGRLDGQRARDHANSIGFPADRPIYMAIDQDVVTEAEFAAMIDYLRGAGESLGGTYVTGVYGEADVIDRARDAKAASWFWQTKAWSQKRVTAAHLLQLIGTVYVGGIGCDINDVLADDWGQHNGGDMTPEEHNMLQAVYDGMYHGGKSTPGGRPLTETWGATLSTVTGLTDDEQNILGAVAAGKAEVLAAVAAIQPGGTPTPEQIAALAAQLNGLLGPSIAAELGRRLTEGNPA